MHLSVCYTTVFTAALNKWNEGVEEVKNLVKKDSVLGIKRSSTSIGSSTSAINSKSNTSKGNKNGGDSGAHSVSSDSSGRANSQHTAIIPTPISTADKNSALNNTSQINYRVSPTLTFKDWMKQKRNRTNTPH